MTLTLGELWGAWLMHARFDVCASFGDVRAKAIDRQEKAQKSSEEWRGKTTVPPTK